MVKVPGAIQRTRMPTPAMVRSAQWPYWSSPLALAHSGVAPALPGGPDDEAGSPIVGAQAATRMSTMAARTNGRGGMQELRDGWDLSCGRGGGTAARMVGRGQRAATQSWYGKAAQSQALSRPSQQ